MEARNERMVFEREPYGYVSKAELSTVQVHAKGGLGSSLALQTQTEPLKQNKRHSEGGEGKEIPRR